MKVLWSTVTYVKYIIYSIFSTHLAGHRKHCYSFILYLHWLNYLGDGYELPIQTALQDTVFGSANKNRFSPSFSHSPNRAI